VEQGRGDRAGDDAYVPDGSGHNPAGEKHHKADEATVLAGGTEPDATAPVDDGDATTRRDDARSDLEVGGTSEPASSLNQGLASPSPQDDGPEQGDTHGGDAQATSPDDPDAGAGELSENQVDAALVTGDAPGPDLARPNTAAGLAASAPAPIVSPAAAPDPRHDGRAEVGRKSRRGHRRGAARTATEPTPYRIVKTRQSPNAGDAAVVVDGDSATVWTTTPGATPTEAWVVLDLGKPRAIRSVRWLVAAEGLEGTLRLEVSTDGKRWKKATGENQEANAGWQELTLKHAVESRYVRLVVSNPTGAPRLGGLAEVEVRAAGTAAGHRDGSKHDRQRAEAGSRKTTSGHDHTGDHKGAKDRHGGKRSKPGKDKHSQHADHKRRPR
jgi:hypothetical protein